MEQGSGWCFLKDSIASFSNCTFAENKATKHGGACILLVPVDIRLEMQVWLRNEAAYSGGASIFRITSTSSLNNCIFEENKATTGNGGATWIDDSTGTIFFTQVTWIRNEVQAYSGGGVYIRGSIALFSSARFKKIKHGVVSILVEL